MEIGKADPTGKAKSFLVIVEFSHKLMSKIQPVVTR